MGFDKSVCRLSSVKSDRVLYSKFNYMTRIETLPPQPAFKLLNVPIFDCHMLANCLLLFFQLKSI